MTVEDLRRGMVVWSQDWSGARVAVDVEVVGRTPVPEGHHMIRLTLADGCVLSASTRHPLPDGRRSPS